MEQFIGTLYYLSLMVYNLHYNLEGFAEIIWLNLIFLHWVNVIVTLASHGPNIPQITRVVRRYVERVLLAPSWEGYFLDVRAILDRSCAIHRESVKIAEEAIIFATVMKLFCDRWYILRYTKLGAHCLLYHKRISRLSGFWEASVRHQSPHTSITYKNFFYLKIYKFSKNIRL